MAVFAMVTTLCARPLMAFADGDDTYWPEGPQINSPCAVVMEVNTGTVLYEKNSHEKHYPASITKILTTYLTQEALRVWQAHPLYGCRMPLPLSPVQ